MFKDIINKLFGNRQPQKLISPIAPTPTPDWNRIRNEIAQRLRNRLTPTPTLPANPYDRYITQYFPQSEHEFARRVMSGESSNRPNIVHINRPGGGFSQTIDNPTQLESLLAENPSVDIGLLQLNTAKAMKDYLDRLGLKYTDLLDPETNIRIAGDLYSGRIPFTSPGWGNWVVARNLGYTK
jgi:hypothetical protein